MEAIISKWGNSSAIKLPKPYLEKLGIEENDMVDIFTENKKIIIQKQSKTTGKSTRQRLEEFYGKDFETILEEHQYDYKEIDSGNPVGREIW